MKRIYTLIQATLVMLLVILLFSACKKSIATEKVPATEIFTSPMNLPLYTGDSINIGSITFSKESQGEAKVLISVNKAALKSELFPYKPTLISSTLPTANLQPLDAEGVSETVPVISTNNSLIVSYNSLMFMRDLKLEISDRNNNKIIIADAH